MGLNIYNPSEVNVLKANITNLEDRKYRLKIGSINQFGAGITAGDTTEGVLCAVKALTERKAYGITAASKIQRMPVGWLFHDSLVGASAKLWYSANNADSAAELTTFDGLLTSGIPSGWHFAVGEAGEIIAVLDGDTQARGTYAPRVFTTSNNYAASSEVAFVAPATFPIGWLQNSGMDFAKDASGNEYFMFGEYTGLHNADDKIYVWKVTKPYANVANWTKVLTLDQTSYSGATDGDVWHVHTCQYDPYSGVWYVTTGDADTCCKWYKSEDHGATWALIISGAIWGSQVNRVLNLVFTKDYIYWANDYGTNHGLYRLPRDANGKMNVAVAPTKLCDLNPNQSTYATILLHEPSGLLMLDRVDAAFAGNTNKLDVEFWSFADNKKYVLDTLIRRSDSPTNEFGFRCKVYTLNQGLNDKRIIVGFGENANRIEMPWNNSGRRTTLALEVY